MEGVALSDIIENNMLDEDQLVSGICLEVSTFRLWWTMF